MKRDFIFDATHRNALEIAQRLLEESEGYFSLLQPQGVQVLFLRDLGIAQPVRWSELLSIIDKHPDACILSPISALYGISGIAPRMDYFMKGAKDHVVAAMPLLFDEEINRYFAYIFVRRDKGNDLVTVSRRYVEQGELFGPHIAIACGWSKQEPFT